MDLSKFSDADLLALESRDLSKISDAGLAILSGEIPKPVASAMPSGPRTMGTNISSDVHR
jgi:hypothetical protein